MLAQTGESNADPKRIHVDRTIFRVCATDCLKTKLVLRNTSDSTLALKFVILLELQPFKLASCFTSKRHIKGVH